MQQIAFIMQKKKKHGGEIEPDGFAERARRAAEKNKKKEE